MGIVSNQGIDTRARVALCAMERRMWVYLAVGPDVMCACPRTPIPIGFYGRGAVQSVSFTWPQLDATVSEGAPTEVAHKAAGVMQ